MANHLVSSLNVQRIIVQNAYPLYVGVVGAERTVLPEDDPAGIALFHGSQSLKGQACLVRETMKPRSFTFNLGPPSCGPRKVSEQLCCKVHEKDYFQLLI
jgi:hypothetical protein